jgi:hypothetical protein
MKKYINFNADATEGGAELTPEQQLVEVMKAETTKAIESKIAEVKAELTSNEAKSIETLTDAVSKAATIENLDALKAELNEAILSIKANSETKKTNKKMNKSFAQNLAEAIIAKKAEFDAIVANGGNQKESVNIEVKSAITMSVDSFVDGSSLPTLQAQFSGIVTSVRTPMDVYLGVVSTGTTSGNMVTWVEETDQQGQPVFIAEGSGKTQLSSVWAEKFAPVKKVGVYGKVTTEMMADLPQLIAYIQNSLVKRLEAQVLSGLFNGNGLSANIKGIFEYATPFAAGSLAGTVTTPNAYDVIEAVATQVLKANGTPNAIYVNPVTLAQMHLSKSTYGEYVLPPFQTVDGTTVAGMKVIPTNFVAEDEFVGGDMSVVNVAIRENASITIGLDGNDFTNNLKTILVEKRLAQFVSGNDTPCIVKGEIGSAIAALAV